MKQGQPRENYLGFKGWGWAGKYKLERYLYLLHRITGLGILLYLLFHFCVMTIIRLLGEDVYQAVMGLFEHPLFKAGEYLVFAAFVFHALNGLRLILQELGFLLGRPTPPIFPYKDSLRKKRPLTLGMVAIIVILVAMVLFDFVKGGL